MRHGFHLNEEEISVALTRGRDGFQLLVDDDQLQFELREEIDGSYSLITGQRAERLHAAMDGDLVHIHLAGETYCLRFEHALQRLAQINDAGAADQIRASMPGSIVSLDVAAGDHVKKGQTLLVMESMKMETTILAPRDGVVADIQLASGQTFDKDAVLLSLEPESE